MFSFLHIFQVQLEAGLEVEGVFWENLDRRVHSNGTIVYKVMSLSLCSGWMVPMFRRLEWSSMESSLWEALQMEVR